jgi:hypothetical protein
VRLFFSVQRGSALTTKSCWHKIRAAPNLLDAAEEIIGKNTY